MTSGDEAVGGAPGELPASVFPEGKGEAATPARPVPGWGRWLERAAWLSLSQGPLVPNMHPLASLGRNSESLTKPWLTKRGLTTLWVVFLCVPKSPTRPVGIAAPPVLCVARSLTVTRWLLQPQALSLSSRKEEGGMTADKRQKQTNHQLLGAQVSLPSRVACHCHLCFHITQPPLLR